MVEGVGVKRKTIAKAMHKKKIFAKNCCTFEYEVGFAEKKAEVKTKVMVIAFEEFHNSFHHLSICYFAFGILL